MKLVFILISLTFSLPVTGQSPLIRTIPFDSQYGKIRISNTYVDHKGFLWLGTDAGLFSFDGHSYTHWQHPDTSIHSEITALFEDRDRRLWIGYNSGNIDYLDGGQLELWKIQEGLPKVPITGFCQDSAGNLWFSTYGEGLYCYKENRLYNFNVDDGMSSDDIYCLLYHQNGSVWAGTDQGLNICGWDQDQKTMEHHSINQGIPDELILSLHAAADDKVWIGTHNEGFGTYNSKKQMFFSQFPKWSHGPVQEIISLGDHIYIGTEEKGLWAYSLPHQTLFSIHKSAEIDQRSIADMAVDRKNNLWVAYGQSELQLINHQFEYYEIEQGPIQAILPDRENSVWIGTPTGLFQKHLDRPDLPITHHIPQYTLNIISLDRDSLGRLWLGTFGQGLFCYDPDTGQISSLTEASGLLNNSILSINIQTDEVWLASLGGAFKIEFEPKPAHYNFSIAPQIDGLGSSYIYQIFPAKNGRIWFATDGRGLSYLENDHVVTIGASESGKSIKTVYSITEDKQHRIWFISGTDEVYYQTANGFRSFDRIKTGLNLAGITTTYTGDIMVSHQDGLIMINPANFNISYLSEEYELDNLKPHLNTFAIDSIGNIWMGSNQRVLKHRVSQSPYQDVPTTHITQILLFDEPVQNKVDLKFAPRENFIAFKYVGISFLNASKVRYRYRLEGYDRDWNYTRDQRVSYSHLPAGTYTFKVQASINDEFNSSEITSSSFQIRKAFYNHAGFWVFMVLLSYRLIYLFAKSREKKLQKIAKQKREQIEFQYHQLQNQINPHFLFNSYNTLLSIIEEKPETASEYVEKLSDFYRQIIMLKEKDIVTVSEEIELVKNYFYLLQNRYGAHIDLRIDVHSTEKHLAPMSLQMLVENAVKHNIISKKHPLSIEIYEDQDKIVVMNNLQPKLHAEPSTGFGLNNIRERYKLLSGEPVEIFTSSNQFSVSLPLVTKPSYV